MSVSVSWGRTSRRGVAAVGVTAAAMALSGVVPLGGGTQRASGQAPGSPKAQTDASVPAQDVTMIGSTPSEAGSGRFETWGMGQGPSGATLVRYTQQSGWSLAPALQDEAGKALTGFELDTPEAFSSHAGPSTIAGQMTADGAGVLAGSVEGGDHQVLLVRQPNNPANPFREVAPLPEGDLEHGEMLFGLTRAPLLAPLDEGSSAGALVVPVRERGNGIEERVLHWSGAKEEWTSEKIELPSSASSTEFRVLGIGASSPANAWLIAQLSSEQVGLFQRKQEGGEATWQPVALKSGGTAGEAITVNGEPFTIPGSEHERVQTQVLTVTSQGVWIDGERPEVHASTTIFFRPEAGSSAPSMTTWCNLELSPAGASKCQHDLPQALPTGASRSIAWANSSTPFGERVITGFSEGATLRLDGETFTTVLGLGGSGGHDQGGTYGGAFSNPREGWLGNYRLPVHLTLEPAASRLAPWPVSFRHALTALAPAPGQAVGSLSSEALAVGDLGEVARYAPGKGWLPESLLGPGGVRQTPRLRAVAWPVPGRAYAVGDLGQMWLWRGETGLWEPDPAAPYNFRGNLLGVAFDPNNAARGYAVGESGVLLGYGKTWSQEPYPAESPCPHSSSPRCTWANASFSSIAFAGSEAIVAYRVLPDITTDRYEGGLIVNTGSGWHVDTSAQEAMGSGVPWAVGALPDGGAAFGASQQVYERQSAGAAWQPTATPFPGGLEPGSLAPFREGGALRVVAAGSVPLTFEVEKEAEAPPGSPPTLIRPYPLASQAEAGVLRQTATGWNDEEHELNNAQGPEGNWQYFDEVYEPDPIAAVLVDPSGALGWAVGGNAEVEEHGGALDTAVVDRYPADGSPPPGVGSSPITAGAGKATFAIGGNAQCASPCAARAGARIGPDVWLESALHRADVPGVRAFLYTGPRLVSPHAINGPKETADTIQFGPELDRYAEILAGSQLPVFAAATPTDLDAASSESTFEAAFSQFAEPFGGGAAHPELGPTGPKPAPCERAECQSAYYAFESTGSAGTVRVIMLDGSGEVEPSQITWLEGELKSAKAASQPAIVVGNPNLIAELAAGNHPSAAVLARVLVQDGASAYFFDSPEQNVDEPLRFGSESIPAIGSGTLGYVNYQSETGGAFIGASGFLLAEVNVAARDATSNRAPVEDKLIPNIGELAIEPEGGTLLRRSQAALFDGLARRPLAGNRTAAGGQSLPETSPYIPIPANCVGAVCATGIFPEYTFTSSKPDIGNFVKPNLASAEQNAVLLGTNEQPIPDSKSGLFCAYNAGTTVVTISAGGLSASLPVTVQAGSVRRPCGTTRLTEVPAKSKAAASPPPAPAPASSPAGPTPVPLVIPALPAALVASAPAAIPHPLPAPTFFLPAAPTAPLLAAVPAPVPTPARPTPPSGTSPVSEPVEAPEKEEEPESATESVSNQAVAYREGEHDPSPVYLIGVLVLAAFAGASIRRRPRGGARGDVQVAPATISSARSQRRIARDRGPWQ